MLITGAGPIGIMAAAVARHVGARHVVITDINQARLDLAAEVADIVPVNVATTDLRSVFPALKMSQGFDVGMEMSGSQAALDQMVEHRKDIARPLCQIAVFVGLMQCCFDP